MKSFLVLLALLVSGCVQTGMSTVPEQQSQEETERVNRALSQFESVIRHIEPVAEQECRLRTTGVNCDYLITIDTRKHMAPNAFQALDDDGRPIVGFTISLLLDVDNIHELALVTAHETAHHILGHVRHKQQDKVAGAVLLGLVGLPELGAQLGVRSNSKEFEIEADILGTIIMKKAGFDPLRGLEYFAHIPDPGNRFLGTHPPHADRIAIIRETAAKL